MSLHCLVSVALCTYNGERFLTKQLDSILSQDYEHIEIIAVDDCSTDKTWAILNDYARRNKRLKVYQNEKNIGYSLNFEKAIKLCTGEFIALSDQDDIWERVKITTCLASIADNQMVYHDSDFIDEHDNVIDHIKLSSNHRMYEGDSCIPLLLRNSISGHATVFKRSLIEFVFPFPNVKFHDWWIAYVALNIGKVKYIDKVLVHYRQHAHSITDSLSQREKSVSKAEKISLFDKISLDLHWLKTCSEYPHNKQPDVIREAYAVFTDIKKGMNKIRCFSFMVKHFDLLFYIIIKKDKKFLSKLNFVRKICYS